MTLLDRLPAMSDIEVNNLLANARRLSEGTDARKEAAAEMLPALEAEAESRAAARSAALSAARKARAPARRKLSQVGESAAA